MTLRETSAALESFSKLIPNAADLEKAVADSRRASSDLAKAEAGLAAGEDLAEVSKTDSAIIDRAARLSILHRFLGDNRLDSHIAGAEAASGDLDVACARIDHMSNQSMRAATLRLLAEGAFERTKQERAKQNGRFEQ